MISSTRRYMELKYNEMHTLVSDRQVDASIDEVGILVKGYWVMAETASPQFVLARSPISSTSALLCILTVLLATSDQILVSSHVSISSVINYCPHNTSHYSWSIRWIIGIQVFGVLIGNCGPIARWACIVKALETERKSFRDELKVDKYWTLKLVEWRDTPLPFRVQNQVCKKLICDVVTYILNFCIGVQILFVSASKLVQFGSVVFLRFCKILRVGGSESSSDGAQVDFNRYVLLLEGEPKLPDYIVKNICRQADRLIQQGEKKQPKNLIRLLRKSANFDGVGRFDNNQVPSLHSQEPPNCWSLSVVTLTAISLALANIADDEANQLLASVSEGLSIVKVIEKTLNRHGEMESIRKE
ncbi:uncharacterized protein LOC125191899 [Salvia hispanica]|uniref:uncharacterized protein LOC125191899 n=1 Tax=Salvia hispanica TaxID=49212 RepID=UPI002009705D|nr:uncharacterized protein LOC125191899 [Salvia hispanica]